MCNRFGSVGGLEKAFCSYPLKVNLKNNINSLFGPTIGQWHKSPSNGPRPSHPVSFRVSGSLVPRRSLLLTRLGVKFCDVIEVTTFGTKLSEWEENAWVLAWVSGGFQEAV